MDNIQRESQLSIPGSRTEGQDVRSQNVIAALSISNIVKSSLGPVGLDKMLVDDIGDVTITNDGATILKMLEVEHPAAKVFVELSQLQDEEVGDGTTSVVILAAELLKRANDLVKNKIHPTSIIAGYRLAMREACKYIKENLTTKADKLGRECLISAAKTTLNSKSIGASGSDFFANLIVDAITQVKVVNENGEARYPLKSVSILKAHGKGLRETQLVDGFALNCTRASQGMPLRVASARIACLDIDLRRAKMGMGVTICVERPDEMQAINQKEMDITKNRIEMVLKAGANVILTTKGIDDAALKYFVDAGAIAVRRVKKDDLRRIAKATGATMCLTLANMEGDESFDASMLGSADEVVEERVGDNELIFVKGCKTSKSCSLLLRGPSDQMLDESERSIHDALCIVKRVLESNEVVVGGGAVEAALSIYLENFANTLGSREQLAIAEFAEALLVIPKTLAVNAACDATDLVARLRADHNAAQTDPKQAHLRWSGLDLTNGKIRNNQAAGVTEPAMSKLKGIQFATEAAITVLRIDDLITLEKPEQEGHGDGC